MELKPYDLPDVGLLEDTSSNLLVWEPDFLCIVLGQSNGVEESVNVEHAEADGVPVYKRPSGGEAVVLSPGMLVISILKLGDRFRSPRLYFDTYNGQIIRVLRELGIRDIGMKGISDICIGDKKILGSSIYRNKDRVLYHGVLNVAGAVDAIERYLRHPVREPAYRKGRVHRDFVTSFVQEGYEFTVKEIRALIIEEIGKTPFSWQNIFLPQRHRDHREEIFI